MEDPTADTDVESEAIERFWELAKFHARLNPAPSYFGPTSLESVRPPAFMLGDTPEEADEALRSLVADEGATLSTPRGEFERDEDLPIVGALGIVLDGVGHPHVLVETLEVDVDDGVVTERLGVVYGA